MKKNLLPALMMLFVFASQNLMAQNYFDAAGNSVLQNMQSTNTPSIPDNSVNNFTIVHQIAPPLSSLNDIAWDGQALWVSSNDNSGIIARINPSTGAIIKSIPANSAYPAGVEFDGTNLWTTDNTNKMVQLLDTATGAVLFSTPTPAMQIVGNSYNTGLTIENAFVWINDPTTGGGGSPDIVTKNTLSIATLNIYYPPVSNYNSGLGFDGNYLWSSDNITDIISQIDPATYTTVSQYNSPSTGGYANGITWDGDYLWITDNGVDSIYQVITNPTNVSTANKKDFEFSVFPNPVKEKGVFLYSADVPLQNAVLHLISTTGTVVKQISLTGFSTVFSRNQLSSGMYYYSLTSNDKTMARGKIILAD